MSNLELSLYQLMKKNLIQADNILFEIGHTQDICNVRARIKHCIDMLDVVYGATKEDVDD